MAELVVLRWVHVLGGLFWVGSAPFSTLFLMPSLAGMGPAAGQLMAGLQKRRPFVVLPTAALLTILSGLRLLWIVSGGFGADYFATATGTTFAWSGGAAVVAFVMGMLVIYPAGVRAAALGAQIAKLPDGTERAALQAELARVNRRSTAAAQLAIVWLTAEAAGMAIARYLG